MKSMLHEASSVTKAIEKAWDDAGKPAEFTIKILETGEKNFLGMSKRPAIVSITYEPKRQPTRQQDLNRTSDRRVQPLNNAPKPNRQPVVDTRNQVRPLLKREPVKTQPVRPVQPKDATKDLEKTKNNEQVEPLIWQDEWVTFVGGQLKELLALWGTPQEFSSRIDKRVLTFTLESKLHDDMVEERNTFVSFSYLLMQFFKRNYKKKFRGFQLIITTKKATP